MKKDIKSKKKTKKTKKTNKIKDNTSYYWDDTSKKWFPSTVCIVEHERLLFWYNIFIPALLILSSIMFPIIVYCFIEIHKMEQEIKELNTQISKIFEPAN